VDLTQLTYHDLETAACHALHMSEIRREDARERRHELHRRAARILQRRINARRLWWQRLLGIRPQVSQALVEVVGDVKASEDTTWKLAVADERWYGAQAVEYAAVANLKKAEGDR
jgi:hypothetical protein